MTLLRSMLVSVVLLATSGFTGTYEIRSYTSQLLGMSLEYLVFIPSTYQDEIAHGRRFPVVYLLHCAGCSDVSWATANEGNMGELIDSSQFIAVAPYDGGKNGWWLDSPKIPSYAFSRFMIAELKPLIDSQYATIPDRSKTGVCGWSMGGFGALHNIIEHPDIFGSAFGIKGGFDLTLPLNPNWPSDYGLYTDLGSNPADSVNWNAVNVLKNIHRIATADVHIGFYRGNSDPTFGQDDRRLDSVMNALAMPHFYFETGEVHVCVPDSSMLQIIHFFDSTFALSGTSVKTCLSSHGETFSGKIRYYDIRGRALLLDHLRQSSGAGIVVKVSANKVQDLTSLTYFPRIWNRARETPMYRFVRLGQQ